MALGDGIRRNIAMVTKEERDRFRNAIIALHHKFYPGSRSETPVGGVSYWFKQDEIHAHTHVHECPAFLPWHRELINRFEALLREVDPMLSLHYWDWTTDPIWMFTSDFMGNASSIGDAGEPWQANTAPWRPDGFYNPSATPFRSNSEFDPNNNPFDPPRNLRRNVQSGAPITAQKDGDIVNAVTFQDLNNLLTDAHNRAHGFIGGAIGNPHTSFRDPFVFLLHSNVDRLFAMWQLNPTHPERLDPAHVYDYGPNDWINPNTGQPQPETGSGDVQSGEPWWGFSSPMEPWAGVNAQTPATGIIANVVSTRPWAPPPFENQMIYKDSRDPTVVKPPGYDIKFATQGMAKAWDVIVLPEVLNQLYQQVLERQTDPVGLIGWGCILSRGEQSMRDIVRNIGHSQEYHDRFIAPLTTTDAVKACYRHFLAREAEPAGLQFWEGVAAQQGFLPVIDGIVASDEYTNKFGNDQVPH